MAGMGIFLLHMWGIRVGLSTYHTAALSGVVPAHRHTARPWGHTPAALLLL